MPASVAAVTAQALAWRLIHQQAQDVWYNWAANVSQVGRKSKRAARACTSPALPCLWDAASSRPRADAVPDLRLRRRALLRLLCRRNALPWWWRWCRAAQVAVPDELPEDLVKQATLLKNVRWYNPRTQEFSWEDPKFQTPWRELQGEGEAQRAQHARVVRPPS